MQSNIRNIGNFMQVDDRQTINYNKDIIMTDLNENSVKVCSCYCTIVAHQSISYYMTVENRDIFESQKDVIQVEIDKFKRDTEKIAKDHFVPII